MSETKNIDKADLAEKLIAKFYKKLNLHERIMLAQHKFDHYLVSENNDSKTYKLVFYE